MRLVSLICILALSQFGLAQGSYDSQWVFNNHNNFIFFEDSLVINVFANPFPNLDPGDYVSNICDRQGNLLFYTGGCYVLNKKHAIMQNGDSITSDYALQYWCGYNDFPMRQNNTILPHPGDTNRYVIFNYNMEKPIDSLAAMPTAFYYHIVDMTEDNGLGAVVQKKQVAIEDTLDRGRMTAVKHANGIDWWVVNSEWHSTCYYATPLTSQGVGTPHLSCPGPVLLSFGGGQATFNPMGTKYVRCDAKNGLWVLDFDNETGMLSNPIELTFPQPPSSYRGVCFSPNSRYLYVASYLQLWQFDMEASDIQASLQLVGEMDVSNPIPGGGSLAFSQLGADGKIYIAGPGNHYYLSRINKPNCPGTACDFRQWEVALLAPNFGGLPNMPHFNIIESDYDCESVSTDESEMKKDAVKVFPNPFTNILQINHSFQGVLSFVLLNSLGQKIVEGKLSTPESFIRVQDDIPPGVYYLSIWSEEGQSSMKIIKTEMR
jgi:hypothetical protein